MITETIESSRKEPASTATSRNLRMPIQSTDFEVLTEIYREDINIAVWQRQLSRDVE